MTSPHPALRATLSPLTRGEGHSEVFRREPFSPPRGEKVPEGRMRGASLEGAQTAKDRPCATGEDPSLRSG
jgi:hypothetical protein